MNRSIVFSLIFSVAILAAAFFGLQNARQIEDWYFLRSYTPSTEIKQLADSSFLSEEGRRLFYASDPEVNDAEEFNDNCPFRERSFVLGCYSGDKIFIFNVIDPRLDGIQEVTAAHEMLHAVYARLDEGEKRELNLLLDKEFEKVTSTRVLDLVQAYREADESSIHNEMHSIFGTELAVISPELESHFEAYFTDRQEIVAVAENYEAVFIELQDEVDSLFESIQGAKQLIESIELQLVDKQNVIQSIEEQLVVFREDIDNARANNNAALESVAVDQFNNLLSQLQLVVGDHNDLVATYNETVEAINRDVATYNSSVIEQSELIDSINSKKEAIPENDQ